MMCDVCRVEYLDGARGKSVVPGHYELVAVAADQLDIPGDCKKLHREHLIGGRGVKLYFTI